eukprot:7425406-Ditylum_brightwellii.AAC.1
MSSSSCVFSSCFTNVRFACVRFFNAAQSESAAFARCSSASVRSPCCCCTAFAPYPILVAVCSSRLSAYAAAKCLLKFGQ